MPGLVQSQHRVPRFDRKDNPSVVLPPLYENETNALYRIPDNAAEDDTPDPSPVGTFLLIPAVSLLTCLFQQPIPVNPTSPDPSMPLIPVSIAQSDSVRYFYFYYLHSFTLNTLPAMY